MIFPSFPDTSLDVFKPCVSPPNPFSAVFSLCPFFVSHQGVNVSSSTWQSVQWVLLEMIFSDVLSILIFKPQSLTYHIPWKKQTSKKERLVFQNIIFEGLWIFQGSNATWFSGQKTFQETKMISEVRNIQCRSQVNHSLNFGVRGNPSSLSPTSMGSQHVFHGPRSWRRLPRRWVTFRDVGLGPFWDINGLE